MGKCPLRWSRLDPLEVDKVVSLKKAPGAE